jgi:very-short-patch-repair endonuclease
MRSFKPRTKSPRLPLTALAHGLRTAPTVSEARLWGALRCRQLHGVAFRRQVVVGPYIVDFLAPEAKLVVEVDGGYHARQSRQDARRDAELRKVGYRVLRLPAQLVMHQLGQAVARIEAALKS